MLGGSKYRYLNVALFQAGWFACIFLPTIYGLAATILVLIIHLKMVPNFQKELAFVITVASVGYCMDSLYSLLSLVEFKVNSESTIYLVCVWLLFASTLNWSMKYLIKTPLRAMLLGILAPLSYFGAQSLGKIKYSEPLAVSILFHALLWSAFMLLVHKLYFGQNSQYTYER